MKNAPLSAYLRDRGLSQEKLAHLIGSSRSHVCEVLNNVPGHGHRTRNKLAPLLTPTELAMAGWDASGRLLNRPSVFHVEGSK